MKGNRFERRRELLRFAQGEKVLFKILFKVETAEDLKLLRKLVKGFLEREGKPQYIVLYKYLDSSQIGGLKKKYGNKIKFIVKPRD